MNVELIEFARQALAAGKSRQDIALALTQAGWRETDVTAALARFADVDFPIPVPRPKPSLSARETFLYLVMFAALYTVAFHLGSMAFRFIDHLFPDAARVESINRFISSVRWDASALVVCFPIFAVTFRAIGRAVAANPELTGSRPRKWLTYLTLFVAAVTLACDLTALVYHLLGGELTERFLLKVAVVAVIAGGTFAYFLTDMRKDEKP